MKRKLALAIIIFSLITISCSKKIDRLSTTEFNIEEAKAAFVNNYTNALGTKSADEVYYSLAGGDYTPVWEMAKANENEHIWSLEVPIISDLQIVLKNKETDLVTSAERKLLFIKSKETQNVHPFIMVSTTSETKSSDNSFEHLADNASYSGYVLYSTLAGEFVNLRSYYKGVEIANVNAMTAETEHHRDCESDNCVENSDGVTIDDVMGSNEFGIMLSAHIGTGEYFEGFCVGCGTAYPYCTCGEVAICPICNNFVINCKCGSDMDGYYFCYDCGCYHKPGECRYICPLCSLPFVDCHCK